MAVTEITKAARNLATAERKLTRVQGNEAAAVAKATAKATKKYAEKVVAAQADVDTAKSALVRLVSAA